MNTDNCWHKVVLCKKKDGSFAIYDSLEDAEKRQESDNLTGEWNPIQFKQNGGQPLIRLMTGDIMSIVDVDIDKDYRVGTITR